MDNDQKQIWQTPDLKVVDASESTLLNVGANPDGFSAS